MIVLLDTNQDHAQAAEEIGLECGELLTPLTRRAWRGKRYGIDNGAFSCFDERTFFSLLKRMEPHKEHCLFVACPDVPTSAMRTRELFRHYATKLGYSRELGGWPIAYVAQNGQEYVEIPWAECAAVFIGGDDAFKLGREVESIIRVAKTLGKWVHVGRVNTPGRLDKFAALGVDSIDGTGISRYSHMRKAIGKAQDMFEVESV